MSDSEEDYDPFIANTIYPDAKAIFSRKNKPLKEVKDNALVIVDTNVLLTPFEVGKESLAKIKETYSNLVQENRLYIPGQVAREFANNRATKLGNLSQKFTSIKNQSGNFPGDKFPLLEGLPEYDNFVSKRDEIRKLSKEYGDVVDDIITLIKNWSWDDPVSKMYSDLFKGDVVMELDITDKKDILKDFNHRKLHKLPPGYKDSSKDDGGIGDFLIWLTILDLAKTRKQDAIFVTGEEKPDWWHRSNNKGLYPRYELIDEYHRTSGEKSFHIISFTEFLELFGASKDVIKEIGKLESQVSKEYSGALAVNKKKKVLRKQRAIQLKRLRRNFKAMWAHLGSYLLDRYYHLQNDMKLPVKIPGNVVSTAFELMENGVIDKNQFNEINEIGAFNSSIESIVRDDLNEWNYYLNKLDKLLRSFNLH